MSAPVEDQPAHRGQPHPRESAERCALRSQLRGDPLPGTAFEAARVLLVEQPGPWGRKGLRESRFDKAAAATLVARAEAEGLRVQAIRRPGRTPAGARRRWAIADCRPGHESLRWGSYGHDAELLDLPVHVGSVIGEPDLEPLYLVCANSRHDPCCALRGRPVAAALHAVRPGRVFESSHLGGDRFAANVLVLPAGLLYGRVLPFAAAEFAAAADAGEVVGALLRGLVGTPPAAQAALAYGYEHLALRRRAQLQVVCAPPLVDGRATIRLRGPHGLLDVVVRAEPGTAAGLSCAKPWSADYLAYRPVSITAVEDDQPSGASSPAG
jgi:hypothetical protein